MATPYLIQQPEVIFNDISGEPLEGGYIYIGQENLNPLTYPVQCYADEALTIPVAQPIRTIGGYTVINGRASNFYAGEKFSIAILDKNQVPIYSSLSWVDSPNLTLRGELADSLGSNIIGYDNAEAYDTGTVGAGMLSIESDVTALENYTPSEFMTLATVLKKANDGGAITIACYGDSLTYGQDTSGTGTGDPINGASQTRSPNPYPEALRTSLTTIGFSATVYNRGYPGDTSSDGLSRWAAASSTDVSIIMYGTNDALNLGGTGLVSVDDFRINISAMIERERAKGSVVILMSPPDVAERIKNAKIAPYRAQMKYLADAYSIPFINAAEQIETITAKWTDNVHLTSFAYNEMGWHIAALFSNRAGAIQHVCAGQIYHPTDHIGYGGSTSFKTISGAKGNNLAISLDPLDVYAIGVYCDTDVLAIIHSLNSQGTASEIKAYYAGESSATSGVESSALSHTSSTGFRQSLTAQKLSKGYRTLYILNIGSVSAYIEAIEFKGLSQGAMNRGFFHKSEALSGSFQPARYSSSVNGWVMSDVSRMLTSNCQFVAKLTLATVNTGGIALMDGMQTAPDNFALNAIFALRSADSLIIRELINGSATGDTTAGSIFPATGSWTGEIEMEISGTTCNIYVDGALALSKPNITINRGYPAVYGSTSQRLICHGALIKGYTKAIYE